MLEKGWPGLFPPRPLRVSQTGFGHQHRRLSWIPCPCALQRERPLTVLGATSGQPQPLCWGWLLLCGRRSCQPRVQSWVKVPGRGPQAHEPVLREDQSLCPVLEGPGSGWWGHILASVADLIPYSSGVCSQRLSQPTCPGIGINAGSKNSAGI